MASRSASKKSGTLLGRYNDNWAMSFVCVVHFGAAAAVVCARRKRSSTIGSDRPEADVHLSPT